jgi:hypothetical protein
MQRSGQKIEFPAVDLLFIIPEQQRRRMPEPELSQEIAVNDCAGKNSTGTMSAVNLPSASRASIPITVIS